MIQNMVNRARQCAAIAAAVLLLAGICRADDWSITTADFQTKSVQLHSLSADGLGVTPTDSKGPQIIPLNQFVSIHRTGTDEPPASPFTLSLIGGDRFVGAPGPVTHEKLTWISPSLGQMLVPFSRLASISRGLNLAATSVETPKQDVVTLTNGDTVAGVFTDNADSKVTLQTDAGANTIPLESIRHISFAATGPPPAMIAHGYRLHLTDFSIVTAQDTTVDADQVTITLPGKDAVKVSLPLATVLGIEQLNGPVTWLSSLVPTEEIQTPYLAGAAHWPAKFDLSVDGSPLCFDGEIYDHGIGVHAYSKLTFAIDPQLKIFRTQYAIDSPRDQPRRFADVTVRVLLDGKVVHEQAHFREGELSPVVMLDLNSARTLTLECDYGNAGDTQAHLDWLQPALLRAAPPATAPASQP